MPTVAKEARRGSTKSRRLRAGTPLHDHLGFLEATAVAIFEAPELLPGERAAWLIARVRATLELP